MPERDAGSCEHPHRKQKDTERDVQKRRKRGKRPEGIRTEDQLRAAPIRPGDPVIV